jgi:hypothetical protein
LSKIDLTCAPAPNVGRWSGLRLLHLAARALLSALQDSRERATRKIIRDYRQLLPEQPGANSSPERVNGKTRKSQGILKGPE